VNVQLIDAESANHLWAERFDEPVADLLDMQDEIVSRLANMLEAQLFEAEARRAERSPNPDSTDLMYQGLACFNKGLNPEDLTQSGDFYRRALTLDPRNVDALVGSAMVDASLAAIALSDERDARLAAAEAALTKALSLAPRHALAHLVLGYVQIFTNRATRAIGQCEEALLLDRNLADAHACIGLAKYFSGRGAETEAHVQEAIRISPRDIRAYLWMSYVGVAKLHLGADAEAVLWLRRSIDANRNQPLGHFQLGAALALFGEVEEGRSVVKAGLAFNPAFTIRRFRERTLDIDNAIFIAGRERICGGMRLAGVPEK
jgi:tetratricopeptide (TPR) repeat protein